jgi:hypothetical protein
MLVAVLLAPTNGNVIETNPLQAESAEVPTLVTLFGISILVKALQYPNA